MKKIIYIPIVHNQADLGSLGPKLSLEGERKYGQEAWQDHLFQVETSWDKIEKNIHQQTSNFSMNKIRLYQDGLPVAGETGLKIIKEVAKLGSKNYKILEELINQGAQLEEAESRELLVQEYEYISRISKTTNPTEQLKAYLEYQEIAEELLNKRDTYIANKINTTLKKDELGIAFFGGKHSIINKLNKDISMNLIQEFNDKISADLINQ